MHEIIIAYDRMDADSGCETDAACKTEHLPEAARGGAAPDAKQDGNSCRTDAAAKPCAVVSDERHEARINGSQIIGNDFHEG